MSTITLAILIGVTSLLLPYADRIRPQVEQWLERRIGEPVAIGALTGIWRGPGPVLRLSDLRIEGGTDLRVESAEISFDLLSWLKPGSGPTHFRLVTDEVEIERVDKGRWTVAGLSAGRPAGAPEERNLAWLGLLSDVGLRAEAVVVRDRISGRWQRYPGLDLRLHNAGDHQRLRGTLGDPAGGAGTIEFVVQTEASLTREPRTPARMYARATNIDLSRWLASFPIAGAAVRAGSLNGQLWGHWNGALLERVRFDGAIEELSLAGATGLLLESGERLDTRYRLDRIAGQLQLEFQSRGVWRMVLKNADIVRAERAWPVGELAVARYKDEHGVAYYSMGADY